MDVRAFEVLTPAGIPESSDSSHRLVHRRVLRLAVHQNVTEQRPVSCALMADLPSAGGCWSLLWACLGDVIVNPSASRSSSGSKRVSGSPDLLKNNFVSGVVFPTTFGCLFSFSSPSKLEALDVRA